MNYLKILGASGSKTKLAGTTSFQIYKDILIDAGNVINTLGDDIIYINHIFITHSHSDHINDLPFIIESFFEKRDIPLTIYASKKTISSLKAHTFNNEIWPDFSQINLLNSNTKSLIFKVIEPNEPINLGPHCITPIIANHIEGSYGFSVIKDETSGYLISGDTHKNELLWDYINKNKKIKSLIVECSFPSHMEDLARMSKHLTPKILKEQLNYLTRDDLQIFIYHLKPLFYNEIVEEIKKYEILYHGGKVLEDGDVIHIESGEIEKNMISQIKFDRIMEINLELSKEMDKNKLFEMILSLTIELTHCEAGTLYIKSKDQKSLEFKVIQNNPMSIKMGGREDNITWESLPLYLQNGEKNNKMVAAVSALENKIINIPDVYNSSLYEFKGTKEFDKRTGYHSKSMLVIPLVNHENDVIGVLQLINKTIVLKDIIAFDNSDEKVLKALASQAALALNNTQLISNLEDFLNSFISITAKAIDAKSKHTMNHIGKVAKIAKLIAISIHEDKTIYKKINYTKNDIKQIELAALMHDIGKISMPEHIMDKATKLEVIVDRIDIIKERCEIIKRDLEISFLKNNISEESYLNSIKQITEDFLFLQTCNIGGEFMQDKDIDRLKQISKYSYFLNKEKIFLLNEEDITHLSIRKGTLSDEEKVIMNNHAQLSLDMLSTLPFPKKYRNVLNIAVNHHEKLNGEGYPRGLKNKEITLEDRIMILADIFEALTSKDRPYKDTKKLSEVFQILSKMAKNNEIDSQLLKFFHSHEILEKYSKEELSKEQFDKSSIDI